jgi:hypothetical protein
VKSHPTRLHHLAEVAAIVGEEQDFANVPDNEPIREDRQAERSHHKLTRTLAPFADPPQKPAVGERIDHDIPLIHETNLLVFNADLPRFFQLGQRYDPTTGFQPNRPGLRRYEARLNHDDCSKHQAEQDLGFFHYPLLLILTIEQAQYSGS